MSQESCSNDMTGTSSRAGTVRASVRAGQTVDVILKSDQQSGKLTRGIVQEILTNSATHPHGIKVRLRDGRVGRVARITDEGASS